MKINKSNVSIPSLYEFCGAEAQIRINPNFFGKTKRIRLKLDVKSSPVLYRVISRQLAGFEIKLLNAKLHKCN